MAVKAAALLIIIVLSVSGAAAYYASTQDSTNNSTTTTPQPALSSTPTAQPTSLPQQTLNPQGTSTQPTVTFNYSQTKVEYTDSNTIITLKVAVDMPPGPENGIYTDKFYLISNETKISYKTTDRSWSGYPLTIEFTVAGHFNGDYELRYNSSKATYLYNKVPT